MGDANVRRLTVQSARRLDTWAVVLATFLSVTNAAGVAVGVVILVRNGHHVMRAGVIIGSSLFAELFVLVGCFACQAVARYIELNADRPRAS